jgi:hypothetical protein
MSDFAPGDVVVCVEDRPCDCCGLKMANIRRRDLYRVEREMPRIGGPGRALVLSGVPAEPGHPRGYFAPRFRKVRPASESFTRQIRACRPIKTRVEA